MLDAWDHPIQYRCPGPIHKNGWDLISFGPNGISEDGKGDDVVVGEDLPAGVRPVLRERAVQGVRQLLCNAVQDIDGWKKIDLTDLLKTPPKGGVLLGLESYGARLEPYPQHCTGSIRAGESGSEVHFDTKADQYPIRVPSAGMSVIEVRVDRGSPPLRIFLDGYFEYESN